MTSKPGTLEDRVEKFKQKSLMYSQPAYLLLSEANDLIDDLWASLQTYREIEHEDCQCKEWKEP